MNAAELVQKECPFSVCIHFPEEMDILARRAFIAHPSLPPNRDARSVISRLIHISVGHFLARPSKDDIHEPDEYFDIVTETSYFSLNSKLLAEFKFHNCHDRI